MSAKRKYDRGDGGTVWAHVVVVPCTLACGSRKIPILYMIHTSSQKTIDLYIFPDEPDRTGVPGFNMKSTPMSVSKAALA